jgi:hypothetical protein
MKKYILGLLTVAHTAALADCQTCPPGIDWFYLRAQVGPSFSRKADLHVNLTQWDPANEGYNATLGTAPFFGFGFGVIPTDWLTLGASVNYRGKYKYKKEQTVPAGAATPGLLPNKTRHFNVDSLSFTADIFFNRVVDSCFTYDFCGATFIPYIGGSIGWAQNNLYDFHSTLTETVVISGVPYNTVASIMTPNSRLSFAWTVEIGFDVTMCRLVVLGLAYRYFDGGKFKSNDYTVDLIPGSVRPVAPSAWTGKLRAHELVANFAINF